jgi:hypothetical protein
MENETLSFGMYAFYVLRVILVAASLTGIAWLFCGKWLMKKIEQMEIETGQQ